MTDKIKTLIVTDYMGTLTQEPEEEAEDIARQFQQDYKIELDWTHQTAANNLDEVNPKLIIIDYGGIMPGSDTDLHQVRAVGKWAQAHPSRLVLIWTSFTSRIWKFDLEDEFDEMDNVLLWEPGGEYYHSSTPFDELQEHQQETILKIRYWYNIPEPTAEPTEPVLKLKPPGRRNK